MQSRSFSASKRLRGACLRFATGVTLLELIFVLTILAALATLTLSGYLAWKRKALLSSCLSEISLRLREARNFAVQAGISSVTYVNAPENTVRSFSFRPALRMDFDHGFSAREASWGVKLKEGRVGKGILLDGSSAFALPDAGRFIAPEGFAITLFVLPLRLPKEDQSWYLLKGGEDFAISIMADGALKLKMGKWEGRTRSLIIVPGKWQEIGFSCRFVCGASLSLTWEGIPLKLYVPIGKASHEVVQGCRASLPRAGLSVGPLEGLVDEVVLYIVLASKAYNVPGEFFILGSSQTIHFAPSGCLDPVYHEKPSEILIAPSYYLEREETGRTLPFRSTRKVKVPEEAISKVVVDLTGRIRIEQRKGTLSAVGKKNKGEGLRRK